MQTSLSILKCFEQQLLYTIHALWISIILASNVVATEITFICDVCFYCGITIKKEGDAHMLNLFLNKNPEEKMSCLTFTSNLICWNNNFNELQ